MIFKNFIFRYNIKMSKFTVAPSVLAYSQYSGAAALASAVQNKVLNYTDASWTAALSTILPAIVSNTGSDATGPITSDSALYNSGGSLSNTATYNHMRIGLDRLVNDLSFGTGLTAPLGPSARIVFTDSTGSVGYDSSRITSTDISSTNIITNAFKATNVAAPTINNNHFNRIEFPEALKADSGIGINSRFSTTIKKMEDRAVFALKKPGSNSVTALIAISKEA